MNQIKQLHKHFDELQFKYGDINLKPIYGAGETNNPEVMFIFMNPTGRNISSDPNWEGLRAPWLGTKQIWNIFKSLSLIDNDVYLKTDRYTTDQWSVEFANEVYENIRKHSVYITNLAKCTQVDARPLNNSVFKEYLEIMYKEIEIVNPRKIVTFGNQVSSIILKKPISVSNYIKDELEVLEIGRKYNTYPTFYPVGQGRRNLPLAVKRISLVISRDRELEKA